MDAEALRRERRRQGTGLAGSVRDDDGPTWSVRPLFPACGHPFESVVFQGTFYGSAAAGYVLPVELFWLASGRDYLKCQRMSS